ncbi:MAG: DMT family transporter [Minisyncoccia bacterium]
MKKPTLILTTVITALVVILFFSNKIESMISFTNMNWLPYSIASTILLGISMSLYKMPSFKGYSSFFSTFWTNIFSAFFVLLSLIIFGQSYLSGLLSISWYAIIWGGFFAINMVLQKILLHSVETNSAYPVTSSIGSIVTVLIGITVLSEHVSLVQALGVIIILLSVFLFTRKSGSFPLDQKTILLSLGIIASSTASKYVQKLGAVNDSVTHFMLWQYLGAAIFAIFIAYIFEKRKFKEITHLGKYWKGSALIGLFSVLGGYAIFKALSIGPLSGVYAIHPAYTFIAAIFGFVFFKEKLTKKKIILALISIVGIILLKIG